MKRKCEILARLSRRSYQEQDISFSYSRVNKSYEKNGRPRNIVDFPNLKIRIEMRIYLYYIYMQHYIDIEIN